MTALPIRPMLPPEQVMLFVQEVRDRLTLVPLNETEYFEPIQQTAAAGFTSGRVYDAAFALCGQGEGPDYRHVEPGTFSGHRSRTIR